LAPTGMRPITQPKRQCAQLASCIIIAITSPHNRVVTTSPHNRVVTPSLIHPCRRVIVCPFWNRKLEEDGKWIVCAHSSASPKRWALFSHIFKVWRRCVDNIFCA
jgi:hypothetical protein